MLAFPSGPLITLGLDKLGTYIFHVTFKRQPNYLSNSLDFMLAGVGNFGIFYGGIPQP